MSEFFKECPDWGARCFISCRTASLCPHNGLVPAHPACGELQPMDKVIRNQQVLVKCDDGDYEVVTFPDGWMPGAMGGTHYIAWAEILPGGE